jgi:hypothetical protein
MASKLLRNIPDSNQTLSPEKDHAMSENIVAAAIRLPAGKIVSVPAPGSHQDAIQAARDAGTFHAEIHGSEQGFMTSAGRFVDRRKAARIAVVAGQRRRATGPNDLLFSDDVW